MGTLRLEVFATEQTGGSTTIVTDMNALEEARLAAYEQGYSAGWDDANSTQTDDQTRMRADLARNIQSLGFTYHEARVHVLRALEPLLKEITTRLLPEFARESFGLLVLEHLMPLAQTVAAAPVTLVMNPVARPAIEALLDSTSSLPLTLVEEPSLGEGQVYLRMGDSETRIDLDRALTDITTALLNFFKFAEKDQRYG